MTSPRAALAVLVPGGGSLRLDGTGHFFLAARGGLATVFLGGLTAPARSAVGQAVRGTSSPG
ncbi:hypothetical protein ACFXDJ_20625 [Streptomyces sp. NPDC059443]|uniref:hypothetical protein n=1 Tax=unclassified Streptomyces TaxID=2593676 RepID=UPI003685334B